MSGEAAGPGRRAAPAMGGPVAGRALIAASMLLDLPSALARLLVVAVVFGLFLPLGALTDALSFLAAFGPWVRSAVAALLPIPAGPAYRACTGARRPSARERQAIERSFAVIAAAAPPRSLRVVDSPDENAWVLGTSLFVSRGLFESPHLTAVLAHEAGHLAAGDGLVALAAWWLPVRWLAAPARRLIRGPAAPGLGGPVARTLPQPHGAVVDPSRPAGGPGGVLRALVRLPAIGLGALLLLLAGGVVPVVLRPAWAAYRRRREYAADAFAAAAGQGRALVEALADWQVLDLATPWWLGRTHPYVEQRIDRLRVPR
jgi:Zn-dependent protease with chaperone function